MKRCCLAFSAPLLLVCSQVAFAQTDSRESDRRTGVTLSAPDDANVVIDGVVGRRFPANAYRGVMQVLASPEVSLNGKPERLSAGSRIRDLDNRIVSPAHLAGIKYVVNYRRGIGGELSDVWLLSAEEAKVKLASDSAKDKAAEREKNSFFSTTEKPAVDNGNTPYDQLPKWNPTTPR